VWRANILKIIELHFKDLRPIVRGQEASNIGEVDIRDSEGVKMDWHFYGIWLAVASCITFLLYGFDKTQSRGRGWRVPEVVLHGLALAGGFFGGWAGRAVFRHKTQKGIVVFVLLVSTVLHAGLVYWLFFR
jgi:uncharacterized membrane protein YsdA (DUF1294 family)